MLKMAKRGTPDAVLKAREAVEEAEKELADLRTEKAAQEAERRTLEAEWNEYRKRGGHVVFGAYPSRADGDTRARRARQINDSIRAVTEQLRVRQERARLVAQRAEPLSSDARARLEELVRWAEADAELAEKMGRNPCELLVSGAAGRDELLAFAEMHGVEVGR